MDLVQKVDHGTQCTIVLGNPNDDLEIPMESDILKEIEIIEAAGWTHMTIWTAIGGGPQPSSSSARPHRALSATKVVGCFSMT